MKLSIITEDNLLLIESYRQLLEKISTEKNIPIPKLKELIQQADPIETGSKEYSQFILKLFSRNNIRLPEDSYRVREAIKTFNRIKASLPPEQRVINKFKTLHDLESACEGVENISKTKGELKWNE